MIKLLRNWRIWSIASGFGSLCGVAIILPIQVGFPLDAQRGAIPKEAMRRRPWRFAYPEPAIKKGLKPAKAE
ncbi:MAG: hypothetical protein O9274_02755 [Limnobacter sp.]|uniref:hypothetical protein n=1 Tax=Limnobacter sp. TaxID=2003368 RepID=UPI0022C16A90|nr:hypothetical protein [Limnobacter sp.]MCZ8014597.1 hypothetical protein [Limnobacter sp.]